MDISITAFRQRCLAIIREVEHKGSRVSITRRGRVVAQLRRATEPADATTQPWEALRRLGGQLRGTPAESVATDDDFDAWR